MTATFKRPLRANQPRLRAYLTLELDATDLAGHGAGLQLRGFEVWEHEFKRGELVVVYPHKRLETKDEGWLFLRPRTGAGDIPRAPLTAWILDQFRRWESLETPAFAGG